MFHQADQATAAKQQVYSELERTVAALDSTADDWFDNTSASVKLRRTDLIAAANLSLRVAASLDEEDAAELQVVANNLRYEANTLVDLEQSLANEEYEHRIGFNQNLFSSAPLADESRSSARRDTDWNLFLDIEPRGFVASNSFVADNSTEIQFRAARFMDDATSGHALSRNAKRELTEQFLARVEHERIAVASHQPVQRVEAEIDVDDSALYF